MPKDHAFSKKLLTWYAQHARDLPWRRTTDPYKIWISEVMLQQTTVATVIPYYERWVKMFPTGKHVARAPLNKILKAWEGLGYYQRARNLHKAAKVMLARFDGRIPEDAPVARQLPGFGDYTTGAVLSIAYGKRLTIVDANVRRVIMRCLAMSGSADAKNNKKIEEFLLKVMPSQRVGDFNQALMELGALVCQSRSPACSSCPLKFSCRAYQNGNPEDIPLRRAKNITRLNAVVAIIEHSGAYFIQQRPKSGLLAGLWEFPGGKVEAGETCQRALRREIKEEIGVEVKSGRHLLDITHFYTRYQVRLSVWRCHVMPLPSEDKTHRWVKATDFKKYPMPAANVRIVKHLLRN